MASRPLLTPHSVITDGSMSANIISEPTIIQNLSMISYDASWTGSSPVGVLYVEVSNTYSINADGSERDAGNWTAVTSSAVSGSPGGLFFDIDQIAAYAIRLRYVRTSGSGSMQAKVNGKVA